MLPNDVFLLLSVVNTKLRDEYSSLAELCEEEGADIGELCEKLKGAGYAYDGAANAFMQV